MEGRAEWQGLTGQLKSHMTETADSVNTDMRDFRTAMMKSFLTLSENVATGDEKSAHATETLEHKLEQKISTLETKLDASQKELDTKFDTILKLLQAQGESSTSR